ncbi:uncharacterized protein TRIADDRAFT_60244 [Trichoplax adhaerens]|uniref:FZ domain-containing protein n=1 Tax=Trichoplax adhaerens TaxID=10228 RepID=B3S7P4_TRIAD|nr:predicted protein [Trichoplax adhaerens]EDV21230.1 predicted protein [Trichoplax adhaerens]|eukprot:XP_002116197.1 predicted protein [Trichoplax adhaerens]
MSLCDNIIDNIDIISINQSNWQLNDTSYEPFGNCALINDNSGSQQLLSISIDPIYDWDIIKNHLNQFEKVLSRFDCRDKSQYRYSMIWRCSDCQAVYYIWLYLSSTVIQVNGTIIKPCLDVCNSVLQRCPYLAASLQHSYDGESAFDCPSENAVQALGNSSYALTNCITYNQSMLDMEKMQYNLTCEENNVYMTTDVTTINKTLHNNFVTEKDFASKCHYRLNRTMYELYVKTAIVNSAIVMLIIFGPIDPYSWALSV